MESNKLIYKKVIVAYVCVIMSILYSCASNNNSEGSIPVADSLNEATVPQNQGDTSFESFIQNFQKADLPFDLKIMESTKKYGSDHLKDIDSLFVRKYISLNKKFYYEKDKDVRYFYVHNLTHNTNFNIILYYQWDNDTIAQYILSTYSKDGSVIDNIEFAGNNGQGDTYKLDGMIDNKLELKFSRLTYEFSPNYPEVKAYKEITEVSHYKINGDGKIEFVERLPQTVKINPNE